MDGGTFECLDGGYPRLTIRRIVALGRLDRGVERLRGRPARSLREDFCGTGAVCCEWVKRRKSNRAVGVDIDREVLSWGRAHNLTRLSVHAAERVALLEANVLAVDTLTETFGDYFGVEFLMGEDFKL